MHMLVIGGDSLIGGAVIRALRARNYRVTMTTRRTTHDNAQIFFDLAATERPAWPKDIDAAFIAVGITAQAACENDPAQAYFMNVTQTARLVRDLQAHGIHSVYPSTNLVLPCDTPMQGVDTPRAPFGVYGRCKAEIEVLFEHDKGVAIARLPKILDRHGGILQDWRERIARGEHITAFSDLMVSPVSLDYAATFIVRLMENRPHGIWHLSGDKEYSYAEIAQALFPSDMVGVCEMPAQQQAACPAHPGLDCAFSEKHLGIPAQPLSDVLKNYHDRHAARA